MLHEQKYVSFSTLRQQSHLAYGGVALLKKIHYSLTCFSSNTRSEDIAS
jgi:hypothetical protein